MTYRPSLDMIYLNEKQLLQVHQLVNRLEDDLDRARRKKNVAQALVVHAELKLALDVLDHCLAILPDATEH